MTPRARTVLGWELAGAVFMTLAGSALHFFFAWTGNWPPAALVAAVNESVWEHLKLAFWPGLVWAFVPAGPAGVPLQARLAIKGVTLMVTAVLIVAVFTSYTGILGRNLLVLDIGIFVTAVLAGQMIAAWLIIRFPGSAIVLRAGWVLLALQLGAYSLFTFLPPEISLFVDGRTGLRGLP